MEFNNIGYYLEPESSPELAFGGVKGILAL